MPRSTETSDTRSPLIGLQATAELGALLASPARPLGTTRILRDGDEAFPAMLELIGSACSEVCFENFIFAGDETGRRFADALAAAAHRGVSVKVLYDPVGTLLVRGGSIARRLENTGAEVRAFRPPSPYLPWTWTRLRHRDHRKTLSVDERCAVVGGLCISNPWSPVSRGGQGWRDTALLVEGPIAADVKRAFTRMWGAEPQEPGEAGPETGATGGPMTMLAADRPGERRVARLYGWLAEHARHSLEITDAYMVLPRAVIGELGRAARRGVRVRILLPGRNNHPVAGAAARHGYESLLAAGVEIWEWEGLMLHAKSVVADAALGLVGSSNLDPLSLQRNYELNLLVADPATGAGMQALFERDLETARPIALAEWRRRPAWVRLAESAGSVFAPAL
jgi:cardiolipin synthase